MKDARIIKLAKNLVNYSTSIKRGENVLVDVHGDGIELAKEIVKEVYRAGGVPFISLNDHEMQRIIYSQCTVKQMKEMAEVELIRMKKMDSYIGIRAARNTGELGDVPADKMKIYMKNYSDPVTEERINNTKWVVLRYPNHAMAQLSGMATEKFEDFYFKVCNMDYKKMSKAMDKLVDAMEKTDRVRITGKGTDLSFSIKGMPAIKCDGTMNIPDGEVFSAPIRESVNGVLQYNTPSEYQGFKYENIRFVFKNGKIVEAASNDNERLNKVLDTDEGARFIGEFSLGVNPYIEKPMMDTLFDEKIAGSIHFTPGRAYEECNNGNKSAIHWDLVCIQRPEYGGGEIWFDDTLVRKEGLFVVENLKCLNPENLK